MSLASTAPHIKAATTAAELQDWGPQADPIIGRSQSSGLVLAKQDHAGERMLEAGLWTCTPGSWRLSMPGDELCYFLGGRAAYTEHNGETIEVAPGAVAHFPSGWTGRCDVEATLRCTYCWSARPPPSSAARPRSCAARKRRGRSRTGVPCRP